MYDKLKQLVSKIKPSTKSGAAGLVASVIVIGAVAVQTAKALVPLLGVVALVAGGAGAAAGLGGGLYAGLTIAEDYATQEVQDAKNLTAVESVQDRAYETRIAEEDLRTSYENDLTELPYQHTTKGYVDRALKNAYSDNMSLADAVTAGQNARSNYSDNIADNIVNSHNTEAHKVAVHNQLLADANASDKIGAREVREVSTWSEFDSAVRNEYNKSDGTVIKLTSDISDSSDTGVKIYALDADKWDALTIDLNGYNITQTGTNSNNVINFDGRGTLDGAGYLSIKNGDINGDIEFKGNSSDTTPELNVTVTDADVSLEADGIDNADTVVRYDTAGKSNVTEITANSGTVNQTDVPAEFSSIDITFNASDIAAANSNYADSSEVPTKSLDVDNNTTVGPFSAVNYTVNGEGRNIITPYKASDGTPVNVSKYEVVVETQDYAGVPQSSVAPVKFGEWRNLMDEVDVKDSQAQNYVGNSTSGYAYEQYTILQNANDSEVTELENLGTWTTQISKEEAADNPQALYAQAYVGTAEGTVTPADTDVTLESAAGEVYTGDLYVHEADDVQGFNSSQNSTDAWQTNTTYNFSSSSQAKLVTPSEVIVLTKDGESEWTLTGAVSGGSAVDEVDNRDQQITSNSDITRWSQPYEQERNQTTEIVNSDGGGIFPGDGSSSEVIMVVLVGAFVLFALRD